MKDREELPVTVVVWRGITIHVRYEARYCGLKDLHHLDIEAVHPERAQLPMTETGYRSHFYYGDEIAEVAAAMLEWLEESAAKPEWKAMEASTRQLTLF
jgi:hypothetical protein